MPVTRARVKAFPRAFVELAGGTQGPTLEFSLLWARCSDGGLGDPPPALPAALPEQSCSLLPELSALSPCGQRAGAPT